MTDYTIGYFLIGASFYFTLASSKWWSQFCAITIIFLASGVSELMLVPLGLLVVYRVFIRSKDLFSYLILAAFVVGAGLNILAPGNTARIGRVDQVFDLTNFVTETLLYGARGVILPIIALYFVSHLPFIRRPLYTMVGRAAKLPRSAAKLMCAFGLLFPFLVIAVLQYSLGAPGPGRAHNVSLFCLIALWPVIISQLKWLQPKHYQGKLPLVLSTTMAILVLLSVNIKRVATDIGSGTHIEFSQRMSAARAILSAQENENQNVVIRDSIPKLKVSMIDGHLVSRDKENWLNRCVAFYYGNTTTEWRPE